MILNIQDFEKCPEAAKNSLWFLRALRDGIADQLIASTSDEKEIENLCSYHWARPHYVRSKLTEGAWPACSLERFDLLWLVIKRIAKIERQAIPGYYIERELLSA